MQEINYLKSMVVRNTEEDKNFRYSYHIRPLCNNGASVRTEGDKGLGHGHS